MATYWENSCSFGLRYVSRYKCLIVSLVFSHLGFWSGNLFLIAPFPDLCLLVPFNSTSRYLDDLLNIDNPYFEGMVNQIYPPELQLNKANISDTEAPFIDLHLSVENGFVSSKIYYKRDDFDFDIVNFPFLDGDVPRLASYGVYISQLIRFARVCNHVTDFNARNKCLTAKLPQQGYRYHKLRYTFSKFYRRHYELISKYNVGLKTLLNEGLPETEFYGGWFTNLRNL